MTATDDAREVLARHRAGRDHPNAAQTCGICRQAWPCPPARLARAWLAAEETDHG